MALLHFDGLNSYNDATDFNQTISENIVQQIGANTSFFGTSYSRFGAPYRGFVGNNTDSGLSWQLKDALSPQTVIFGLVFYKAELNNPAVFTSYPLMRISDGAGNNHLNLCVNSEFGISAYQKTTLLGSSGPNVIKNVTWQLIEVKLYVHGTAGTVEVHVDETDVLNLTGQNTYLWNLTATNITVSGNIISNAYSHTFDTYALYPGRQFSISGSTLNDGTYTVSSSDTNLIYTVESLVAEAAGASITITVLDDGRNYAKRFEFYTMSSNITTYVDAMYICDNTGSKCNDFLGDFRADPLRPNNAGTYTDLTPSAGANYENVDDVIPDDNTTYNGSNTVGHKDSYALENLPAGGLEIFGVKSQMVVAKSDAGFRKAKILTISGATEDLSDEFNLSTSYQMVEKVYEDNPDDSAQWEDADVNAMQVGVNVSA